jgi:signal recognition particle subunit SRP54
MPSQLICVQACFLPSYFYFWVYNVFSFFSEKLSGVVSLFSSKKRVTPADSDAFVRQVRSTLIDADVSLSVVTSFTQALNADLVGLAVPAGLTLSDVLSQKLYTHVTRFLGGQRQPGVVFKQLCPSASLSKIMVMGLQGSGKTTTVAKLAAWIAEAGLSNKNPRSIAVGSVDTRRPAAREQLALLAKRAGFLFCHGVQGESPSKMVSSMLAEAQAAGCDVFVLDTAGRMHVDADLMSELRETREAFQPNHTVWVVDGMIGQESVAIGSAFMKDAPFDSIALTKLDSGTRGGAAFGLSYELSKPIYFMGTGEGIDDFETFEPDRVASRIVGLGDVKGLIERIERATKKESEADSAAVVERMMNGQFTLQDFAQQLSMVGSMGSMGKLMQFLPGMPKVSPEELARKEQGLKKFRALFSSMTPNERLGRSLLTRSRKERVARGAGVTVKDLDDLLSKFEETRQFGRMVKKMGGFGSLFK